MNEKRYFHFTIGPVQGFVAQARRTRDFWAGSFILSWLATVAMKSVEIQEGQSAIKFPMPDENFMKAVELGGGDIKQGNVPNRFKAEVSCDFNPDLVVESVLSAWRGLAEKVWEADFSNSGCHVPTRAIWDRQINGFWDIQWAIVDNESESNTLDKLKNWRTHMPAAEPGVKCMMMDGLQELSGAMRPGRNTSDPKGPYAFWKKLRKGKSTDLRENEYLCAVAYVKRRFVQSFEELKIAMPATSGKGAWHAHGWKLPPNVPSVHYMAAAPWLTQLLNRASEDSEIEDLMWDFHDCAAKLTGGHSEWNSNIQCVRMADGFKKWKTLDGTVFFDSMLENSLLWGDKANDAIDVLKKLKKLRKKASLDPVSPFYAILLMDGDGLGKQMSDIAKQPYITKGLKHFTDKVEGIVNKQNGFLVYAGGDDVLAILPLEYAATCAVEIRTAYNGVFEKINKEASDNKIWIQTSISAAIEYTHIKTPLGKVLGDSHKLLDHIAKDQHGRDSIACRVWKPGGLQLEWAMPWEHALSKANQLHLEHIANRFRAGTDANNSDLPQFASKFFYRIRERFELLTPAVIDGNTANNINNQANGVSTDEATFDVKGKGFENAVSLMAMEYLNSGMAEVNGIRMMNEAKGVVRPLLEQCRYVVRKEVFANTDMKAKPTISFSVNEDGHEGHSVNVQCFKADAALLVRFLANKGVE